MGWDDSSTFDDYAVNGVAATLACCGCGGGSTVTGKQACQGHSYDKATCEAVGCCRWNVLLGCRANDKDGQCYSAGPSTTTASGGNGKKKVVGGLIAGGVIAGAIGAAVIGGTSTTAPGTTASVQTTQGAQTTAPTAETTTTE